MMQASRENQLFQPFNLILKVESREDAQALFAIFSHRNNQRLLGSMTAHKICDEIGDEYKTTGGDRIIANGVTAVDYFYPCK